MTAEPPKVAVLLAAYNGRAWIEEQLVSIRAQANVCVDVYISVDPSSDGTETWCAEYALAHPDVVLLPSSGPFRGASRNFFRLLRDVDLTPYDYVAFSDQDDMWYADKLERALSQLQTSGAGGYSSNVVAFWRDGRRMLVNKAQPQVKWDHLFEAAGPGCTYVLTKELMIRFKSMVVDRWDEVQHIDLHDWFCYAFARSRGFTWFIDPVPGLDYRQHERNQVGVNSGVASAITRLRKITDGWWFSQVRLTALLLEINCPFIGRENKAARVMSWMKLALSVSHCRRRVRDRAVLFVVCLINAVAGRR